MRELSAYEQATIDLDLPVIERWIAQHPALGAEALVDHDAYDSNAGHVLLVVLLHDHSAVRRTRDELAATLSRPEHLRVRRWMPEPAEIERLRKQVRAMRAEGPGHGQISVTWPDSETGFLVVGLDRHDPAFATEIEAVRPGWVRVHPEPMRVDPLV
ncbi:hypothetical protein [Kribbella endophytica]